MDTDLSTLSNEELMALYNKEKAGQGSEPAGPGYAEDLTKATGAAPVIRGGVMAGTALPNIYDLAVPSALGAGIPKAAQWLADKLPDSWGVGDAIRPVTEGVQEAYTGARGAIDKMRKEGATTTDLLGHKASVPPGRVGSHTYGNVMQRTEEGTGPLHQAETLPGKLAQGALEAGPSLMGGAPGSVVKGLGAVTGSELAGAATEGTRFEPWAKLAGGVAGSFVPSGKKAPNLLFPPAPEHQKMVDVVKPHVSGLTAGQITGSPRIQKLEGMGGLSTEPQLAQASSHALSLGGVNTPAAKSGISDLNEVTAAGRAAGQAKTDIFSRNQLRHDQIFNTDLTAARDAAGRVPKAPPKGEKLTPPQKLRRELDNIHDRILMEPTAGRAAPGNRYVSMLGPTAEEIMGDLRSLSKRAWDQGAERVAAGAHATNTAIRNAMDRSLVGTPHEGALGPLREQYTNFKALEGVTRKQGSGTVLPMDKVYSALLQSKNPNAAQSQLGQFANAAEKVGAGKPLPKYDPEHASLAKILGGLTTAGAGGYLHGIGVGGGVPAGGEFLSGYFGTPTVLNMLGNLAGKAVSSKAMQSHLPNAGTDKGMLARLLLTQGAPRIAAETAPE